MKNIFCLLGLTILFFSCQNKKDTLFQIVPPSESGLDFANVLTESDTVNVVNFTNVFNGGGVATGDFDNDGLLDVVMAGNTVASRLYRNVGNLKFEDITEQAGVLHQKWITGISLADVNADGWLDIYFCVSGPTPLEERGNLLYLNNGAKDGQISFTEVAKQCGLAEKSYTTQAAFFDYDRDGDLDVYLLTNGQEAFSHNTRRPKKVRAEGISNDRLYRNEGMGEDGLPHFLDVTVEAGITIEGYGLGIGITDINRDGWPDVYCANDFVTNDLFWINNGDGTFTNRIAQYIRHQTHNGMGVDIADFNNDEWQDIIVMDMLPEAHADQKVMLMEQNYDLFKRGEMLGYEDQYMRNTLQLNTGPDAAGNIVFSEIAMLSGVHSTEWSWAPLAADFDHDGLRDLFISNGYPKNIIDLDYILYLNEMAVFGSDSVITAQMNKLIRELQGLKVRNYFYKNRNGLQFDNVSEDWGVGEGAFSNGAVYADFDNDGDLDILTNNLYEPCYLYENTLMQRENPELLDSRHFLKIQLAGPAQNRFGQGAKLRVVANGQRFFLEQNLYRGFQSTLGPDLHIGLGKAAQVDSLEIEWPDGKYQLLVNIKADQTIVLKHQEANESATNRFALPKAGDLFQAVSDEFGLSAYRHREQDYVDFKLTPLLPHLHSQNGPGLAVGDVNADGLSDFFVGNAGGSAGRLFIQKSQPPYFQEIVFPYDSLQEDMGAAFFDADADGDADLYVVSGGSERTAEVDYYQDRLYLNDGKGDFAKAADALPQLWQSGGPVAVADVDSDGDLDVFRGGRLLPGKYPQSGKSYLLINNGGKFADVTESLAPGLQSADMVTAAVWADLDADGKPELITVGEWAPVRVYGNKEGKLVERQGVFGDAAINGWWNSLAAHDFDLDGDLDLVAGNWGLNTKIKVSKAEPARIFAADFDQSGSFDPIMTYFLKGVEGPAAPRDALIAQINPMRKRFPRYVEYAQADVPRVLSQEEREKALQRVADQFQSCYFENDGKGGFSARPLPLEAQFAPIFGIQPGDFDRDGLPDMLLVGNFYGNETNEGKLDAFSGLLLKGDGKGNFVPKTHHQTGFLANKDAKALAVLPLANGQRLVVVANNNDRLQGYTLR